MKKDTLLLRKVSASLLAATILLSGCGQRGQKPAPQAQPQAAQTEQKAEKAPDQLKGIESNIESIIKDLEGPAVGVKEDKPKEGGQGGQPGQPGQGGQGGQQAQPQAKQPDPWEKPNSVINTLHYQWNTYMPMAVKMNANKSLLDNFSNALNNLTNNIVAKNKMNSLVAACTLYSYIPDFYALYKSETTAEVKRIRYYTRDAVVTATGGNWTQAESDINHLKSIWSLYKNMIPKDMQENTSKLDLSLYEFEKVIKEKNLPLTDIKGKVALSNVEALEKAMDEKAKQGK